MKKETSKSAASMSKTPKLTTKQTKFVKEVAKGKDYTEAYKASYDVSPTTKISTIHEEASRTASLPQVNNALQKLFDINRTSQVVDNLHRLAISAEDEKVQHEATKTWLDRALPKTDSGNTINNFGQILVDQREKYAD